MSPHRFRALEYGQAHLPSEATALTDSISPSLLTRKGRLFLCCPSAVAPERLRRAADAYYGRASFDVQSSLRSAIDALQEDGQGPVEIAALVALDVELSAVATSGMQLLHVRENALYDLTQRLGSPAGADPVPSRALPTSPARLSLGDSVIALPRALVERRGLAQVTKIARHAPNATAAARRLARGLDGAPVLVLHASGFAPSVEIGPVGALKPARPDRAQLRPPRGRSPVGIAALIAVAALILFYWVRRPTFGREDLAKVGAWLLTPAVITAAQGAGAPNGATATVILTDPQPNTPTATPPPATVPPVPLLARSTPDLAPSITPTAGALAAPRLVSPARDESYHGQELVLRWAWPGTLGDDQYFDVRLWLMGSKPKSIAWTKELEYVERIPGSGWHSWTVALVQGHDGKIEQELAVAEMVNFRWSRPSPLSETTAPTTTPPPSTPVPPTRVNPVPGPTRGTPGATKAAG